MKSFIISCLVIVLSGVSARAQAPRSATERAALIHSYQNSLREQATTEARELAKLLRLNESEIQLVREFATVRLQAEQEASAANNDPTSRHAAVEQAAATFQSRVINILNDQQLQTYLNLLAAQTPPPPPVVAEVAPPPVKVRPKTKRTSKYPRTRRH